VTLQHSEVHGERGQQLCGIFVQFRSNAALFFVARTQQASRKAPQFLFCGLLPAHLLYQFLVAVLGE
jgi:hypothetical protein